ncbi:MAG: hypothetical protein FWF02_04890 [Micrococcales bacterium]|nr:hypothetical protein [Micrococcales bacterium]MCL2667029.1 hypothetical protein [Micrococcales bacterium]
MTLDRRRIQTLDLAADSDTAWAYLRRPELIRRWYSYDHDGLSAEIDEVFGTTVRTLADGLRRELEWPDGTAVVLSPTGDSHRTTVTVERPSHDGMSHFDGVRDPADERWIADVHQLEFALAVHPETDRRTWSAVGLDAGPRNDRLLDRVGLHGVHGLPVHGHTETVRPDGVHVGGRLEYRTDLQFGLRLHGQSDALLVVLERPSVAHEANDQLDVVLSTYGLDDDEFATVCARWDAWWGVSASTRRSA